MGDRSVSLTSDSHGAGPLQGGGRGKPAGWCPLRQKPFPAHLVGLQPARVAGQPVDDVPGDHVPRAARKGGVRRARVLQLLPLPRPVHGPVQPETEMDRE